jgi:hypothetical protein
VPVVSVTLPVKLPDRVVNVPALAVNEPLESLATIVDAPLEEAAVVRALSIVPDEMFEALIPLIAAPLPVNEAAFIAPASNSPLAPRKTIVEAPLAVAAVVLAFAIVPEEILEALISVSTAPLPETLVNDPVIPVITLPAKDPLESRSTIVEAPLAEAAEVLALSIVPDEMLEALIFVTPAPLPEIFVNTPFVAETLVELTSVAFTTFPVNDPLESRATIVEAPLAEAAVVNALPIVPLLMLEALMLVSEAPLPEMLAFIVPVTVTLLAKVVF